MILTFTWCAGIPKFYRWLSERYPLLNQPTDVGETPLVDNLYLDMNGIIHNCTHGNDPGTKLTEEEIIVKVFGYLDKLFQVVKPQKLLFMAIDGDCADEATAFFNVSSFAVHTTTPLLCRRCSSCENESAAVKEIPVCQRC